MAKDEGIADYDAYDDIADELQEGEVVEAIVFGAWGWGSLPHDDNAAPTLGYDEPDPPPVPFEQRKRILTLEEARPFMKGWSFHGGYGAPTCYAAYIWTNHRVIWVTQYDGSTSLSSMPRNPLVCQPDMPGG